MRLRAVPDGSVLRFGPTSFVWFGKSIKWTVFLKLQKYMRLIRIPLSSTAGGVIENSVVKVMSRLFLSPALICTLKALNSWLRDSL